MGKPTTPRWNAVSIVGGVRACVAARTVKGQRFLATAAPRLPLPECTTPGECRCVYRKFDDRRAGPRREAEVSGLRRPAAPGQERRNRRGRRSTDHET